MKIMDIWFVAMQVICILMAFLTDNYDKSTFYILLAIWIFKVNEFR